MDGANPRGARDEDRGGGEDREVYPGGLKSVRDRRPHLNISVRVAGCTGSCVREF